MMKIHKGDRIDIEVRPLTPGGVNHLVLTVTADLVENASWDGVNVTLTGLCQLHGELSEAIDALISARAAIEQHRRNSE